MNIFRANLYSLKRILLVLLCGFWSITSFAQGQPAGTVLTVSGNVIAEAESGEPRSLNRRSPVFSGDTIVAADDARVRFKLLDNSSYVVQENSSFTIEEFHFSGSEDGSEVADFYFAEGVMEFVSGHIGKQDSSKFRINTDLAVIGLRGSGGIIRTDSEATRVFVTLGELSARPRTGGDEFILNNGETTIIGLSGEPEREQGNSTGAPQTMTTDGDNIVSNDPAEQQGEEEELASEEGASEEDAAEEANDAGEAPGQETESNDQNALVTPPPSAAEIYTALLPNPLEATQADLQTALSSAIESNPVLYAELVTIAIDMGLEPPNAAIAAIQALGSANISEEIVTDIFFVATEGISNAAEVEAAILSANINATLVANPTEIGGVNINIGSGATAPRPSNSATAPPTSASPAR